MPPQTFLVMVVLAAAPAADGFTLPEQTRGGVTARLTVRVADAGVRLRLDVTGGPLLEVESAAPGGPAHDWEVARNEWCALKGGRLTWTQALTLKPARPGPAALPAVAVRFRDGPAAAWQTVEWVDVLNTMRDGPPPDFLPAAPPAPPWLPWAAGAAVVLALAAGAWGWRRRPPPREALSPEGRAMRELRRLEESSLTDLSSADYHAALSEVVRRHLAERSGLPAAARTTAELLRAAAEPGRLSEEQRALLRDFLGRCDLAKFAPVAASAEERRGAAALARALVGRTAAPDKEAVATAPSR